MLHLFTKSIAINLIQPPNLLPSLAPGIKPWPLILPTQQQAFISNFPLVQKLYFMLRCFNAIGRNLSAELAT
jgi:hypothetical protein